MALAAIDWGQMSATFDAFGEALMQVGQIFVDAVVRVVEFLNSFLTPEVVAMLEEYGWKVRRAETLVNQDC